TRGRVGDAAWRAPWRRQDGAKVTGRSGSNDPDSRTLPPPARRRCPPAGASRARASWLTPAGGDASMARPTTALVPFLCAPFALLAPSLVAQGWLDPVRIPAQPDPGDFHLLGDFDGNGADDLVWFRG